MKLNTPIIQFDENTITQSFKEQPCSNTPSIYAVLQLYAENLLLLTHNK
ncbi:hypothetical protein HDF26_003668 [Pedobacter cryoconitis]|nr:hypothetical protein [Pedobacter cryoconitis]MBB6273208.1 hypothetical protein [Pedobacter cryoconitis]